VEELVELMVNFEAEDEGEMGFMVKLEKRRY